MNAKTPTLISFSGGRTSAYMAIKLLESGLENYIICFANTGKEVEETLDFVNNCDKRFNLGVVWLEYIAEAPGFKIVTYETAARNGEPFEALISKKQYLPNPVARICTQELKVKVLKKYMLSLGFSYWNVAIGIRADEPNRAQRFLLNNQKEPFYYLLPLVVDFPTMLGEILNYWNNQEFDLEAEESNCDLCYLKGKKKLINTIRKRPESVEFWINQEERLSTLKGKSCQFNKGYSYRNLKELAINQPTLPLEESTVNPYSCFCDL